MTARRGCVSLGGTGKSFSERTCPLLPVFMPQPGLCGSRETFSLAMYLLFLFVSTALAEELKGRQVKWPLLGNFFRTSSLAFFYRIFICLCTKASPDALAALYPSPISLLPPRAALPLAPAATPAHVLICLCPMTEPDFADTSSSHRKSDGTQGP